MAVSGTLKPCGDRQRLGVDPRALTGDSARSTAGLAAELDDVCAVDTSLFAVLASSLEVAVTLTFSIDLPFCGDAVGSASAGLRGGSTERGRDLLRGRCLAFATAFRRSEAAGCLSA